MYITNTINYTAYSGNTPVYMERYEIIGTSTEDKGSFEAFNRGTTFTCTDNGDVYVWSGTGWALLNAGSLSGSFETIVGNLPELDTDTKSSAVAAINEVYEDAKSTHYNRAVVFESDFHEATTLAVAGITGVALGSGTIAAGTATADHMGVSAISDSTTANGGYKYLTGLTSFLLKGGERSEFIFSLGAGAARATAFVRMGFQDGATIDATVADGVWLEIVGDGAKATISGKSNDNTGVATTATTYTAEVDGTWYRGIIELNAAGTLATFAVKTCSNDLQVWGNTLATKLPTGAGRFTGWGLIAGETSTDAAGVILNIDYANMSIDRLLVR